MELYQTKKASAQKKKKKSLKWKNNLQNERYLQIISNKRLICKIYIKISNNSKHHHQQQKQPD